MPLNKLQNFIKNTEGRILYVNPNDLDSTDSITNSGNSLAQPFKTIQRALLESARFSFVSGKGNDITEKTTILVFPAEHVIDNRPGYAIYDNNGIAYTVPPTGGIGSPAAPVLSLELDSNFDITQDDNILYKFNSVNGGVIIPRGTSIVGLDLRKTKVRPKYVPNPTDPLIGDSSIFRVTGACYFWQFSFFDGDESGTVYTHPSFFSDAYKTVPRFSHHKLSCFQYADGVNEVGSYGLTDLDMYYSKLSNAFNNYREIPVPEKFPNSSENFAKRDPEWQIVGAFATDPVEISNIISGNGTTANNLITVTTSTPHNLNIDTPIKIKGVGEPNYNVSTKVQNVIDAVTFTYLLESFPINLDANPSSSGANVTVETDTVTGASPYIFNTSLRSVWGMNGMHADGLKASGFRSMVVAQFTAVSLQKDDRAFVKYNPQSRAYEGVDYDTVYGAELATQASQTDTTKIYHLDQEAVYRQGWETSHIKISNDSFIQVVSVFAIGFNKHFDIESGGDASITNSNSNFGQISLNSEGYKAAAFDKDDKAYLTSIIGPRDIDTTEEEEIEWIALDVQKTVTAANPEKLYLLGLDKEDSLPINITQGYRIGARVEDKLYIELNGTEYEGIIKMAPGPNGPSPSSFKSYNVTSVSNNQLTINAHNIATGEKIILNSESGDLPENVTPHIVYYAIRDAGNLIRIATSETNALNGEALTIYGGTSLVVKSRVSDKNSGELGSPIQWDSAQSNWYIWVDSTNTIYNAIVANQTELINDNQGATDLAYVKRIVDDRSLDEKVYKLRVVLPKEQVGAKDPEQSFIIQDSSNTGAGSGDFTKTNITAADYDFKRNQRYIVSTSLSLTTVTVETSAPHSLQVGDEVTVVNVTCSNNTDATANRGFNGKFVVLSVDDFEFTYDTTDTAGREHFPGPESTNDIHARVTADEVRDLPRYERTDNQNNLYIYRNEIISPYIEGEQDGIYHLYALNASNSITEQFTNLNFSQSSVDLYPQLDRDNYDSNPPASKTFALRAPIGDVNTSDLKKSVTREALDKFTRSFGLGLKITNVTSGSTTITLTFDRDHGLGGVATGTLSGNTGYNPGTYYDVKLLNNNANPLVGVWKGARAKVVVDVATNITSITITSAGSAYQPGEILYPDSSVLGIAGLPATYTIPANGIVNNTNDTIQITGDGEYPDEYFRIVQIPATDRIVLQRGGISVPVPTTNQYALLVGPTIFIQSKNYNATTKTATFNTIGAHGLKTGNKITVRNNSAAVAGTYLVDSTNGIDEFTVITDENPSNVGNGYILKHGYSSNQGISDIREENLASRQWTVYAGDTLKVNSAIGDGENETTLQVAEYKTSTGISNRFQMGDYIRVGNEIMRITSSNNTTQFTVIRGALGTRKESHLNNELIIKIKAPAIEFRRPSILRASGHTFEYLGYGPGNYSTGLPQIQVRQLSERESFLVQSQERAGGVVVYTGMNNDGDFFSGNTKTSSSSGEVISYDIPRPTVTGEDPSKSSAVFDEITVKERILVEGGDSGTVLSQFDGPVTFNKNTRFKGAAIFSDSIRIKKDTGTALESAGDVYFKKDLTVDGDVNFGGGLDLNGDLDLKDDDKLYLGDSPNRLEIYHGSNGNSYIKENDPNGHLYLQTSRLFVTNEDDSANILIANDGQGRVRLYDNGTLRFQTGNPDLKIFGNLDFRDSDPNEGIIYANKLEVPNITPIGSIILWPGTIDNFPANWKICNGQQLVIADYLDCYNTLTNNGTTFPFGNNTNGGTQFRLPNMVDRFVVGSGDSYNVGSTGGNKNASLVAHEHTGTSEANNVNHTHSGLTQIQNNNHTHSGSTGDDAPDHTHRVESFPNRNVERGNRSNRSASDEQRSDRESVGASNRHQHPFTTGNQQGNHRHQFSTGDNLADHTHQYTTSNEGVNANNKNLPPYFGMIYLMRVL